MHRLPRFVVVSVLLLALTGLPACSGSVSAEKWRADLKDMVRQLSERHVDLFHSVSKEDFEAAVADLDRRIPSLTPPEILVGIAQIVATVGDGHTSIYTSEQKRWRFGIYPIKLWAFADGIYVFGAAGGNVDLFGKRLIRIDDTPVDEAFRRISTTISADNEMEHTYTVPFELIRSELLHVLGITESADQAEFVFEGGVSRTLQSLTVKKWLKLDWRSPNSLYGGEKPPSMRLDFLFATPLTVEQLKQRKYYWHTYIEGRRTLFLQYNVCWDQKNRPPFREVVEELFRFMDDHPVERLVVDLRQNSGGEPKIAEPLIEELERRRPQFGDDGRLFVLVGRRTYSAALTNAAHLRSRAGARIVGEPPRGKPNSPSEGRDIDLKRTKIRLSVSTQFVERDPALGDADYLPVDIEATYSFADHRRGGDPVLDAALGAELFTNR